MAAHGLGRPLQASYLLLRGWSKAVVNGFGSARDYSLYVDLTHADGTLLEGQVVPFSAGVHDWQERELEIQLTKPVTKMNVYCLYRRRIGQVYFANIVMTAHSNPRAAAATREFSEGYVAANLLPEGTQPIRVDLPPGKVYRDLVTNESVTGHFFRSPAMLLYCCCSQA